jgi:hypothetical protein
MAKKKATATKKASVKKKAPKGRRSAAEIWKTLEPELKKHEQEHSRPGKTFLPISREEFDAKMKRINSPMIVSQSWDDDAAPGGVINYTVGVLNPDPTAWNSLAVALSIGNRNPISGRDLFLNEFDARFPTYAQGAPIGFSLAPGESKSFSFAIRVPAGIEKTGYLGNAVVQRLAFYDVGTYLDRGCFFFNVI